jgi:hypothetical protein
VSGLKQDNSHADAHGYGFSAGRGSELVEYGADVELDGMVGNTETRGHFAVAKALGEHSQDLDLARRQLVEARRHSWRGNTGCQILSHVGIEQYQAGMSRLDRR